MTLIVTQEILANFRVEGKYANAIHTFVKVNYRTPIISTTTFTFFFCTA